MTRTPGASGTAASWLYLGRGLYLATLLLVLSPTPSLGGGFSDTGALVSTRFAFFCAFAVSVLRGCVISGILILLLPPLAGAGAVWLAMPITEALVAVYAVWMIARYTKALPIEKAAA